MQFFIGNKVYTFSKDELDYMYIDEGVEATVYKLNKSALKIYKKYSRKNRLDYDTSKVLSEIPTKRYLLPKRPIYDKDKKFIGYTTDYKEKYSLKHLANMPLKTFCDEVKCLSEDTQALSDKNINIEDLIVENSIYDGKIYICDPGSFSIDKASSPITLSRENNIRLNTFLCEEILGNTMKLSKKQRNGLIHFQENYFLKEELEKHNSSTETVKALVKRITH